MNAVIPVPTRFRPRTAAPHRAALEQNARLARLRRGAGQRVGGFAPDTGAQASSEVGVHVGGPVERVFATRNRTRAFSARRRRRFPRDSTANGATNRPARFSASGSARNSRARRPNNWQLKASDAQIRPQFQMRDARFQHLMRGVARRTGSRRRVRPAHTPKACARQWWYG